MSKTKQHKNEHKGKKMSEDQELYSKEGNENKEAKRAYKRKKKVKARHPMADKVKTFYTRYNGDLNRVSAQLMLPRVIVEQILKDENI